MLNVALLCILSLIIVMLSVATAHLSDTNLGLIVIVKNSIFVNVGGGPCFIFHVSFAGLGFAERG